MSSKDPRVALIVKGFEAYQSMVADLIESINASVAATESLTARLEQNAELAGHAIDKIEGKAPAAKKAPARKTKPEPTEAEEKPEPKKAPPKKTPPKSRAKKKALTLDDITSAYTDFLNAGPEDDEDDEDARIDAIEAITNYFGVERLSNLDEEDWEEAKSYADALMKTDPNDDGVYVVEFQDDEAPTKAKKKSLI